jgi:hypothetical protein
MQPVSLTIEFRSNPGGEDACLRLKVRSCFVKLAARLDAATTASTFLLRGVGGTQII